MLALGIILSILCLLFLVFIIYREEIKSWHRDRRARRKSMDKLFTGDKHGK